MCGLFMPAYQISWWWRCSTVHALTGLVSWIHTFFYFVRFRGKKNNSHSLGPLGHLVYNFFFSTWINGHEKEGRSTRDKQGKKSREVATNFLLISQQINIIKEEFFFFFGEAQQHLHQWPTKSKRWWLWNKEEEGGGRVRELMMMTDPTNTRIDDDNDPITQ